MTWELCRPEVVLGHCWLRLTQHLTVTNGAAETGVTTTRYVPSRPPTRAWDEGARAWEERLFGRLRGVVSGTRRVPPGLGHQRYWILTVGTQKWTLGGSTCHGVVPAGICRPTTRERLSQQSKQQQGHLVLDPQPTDARTRGYRKGSSGEQERGQENKRVRRG